MKPLLRDLKTLKQLLEANILAGRLYCASTICVTIQNVRLLRRGRPRSVAHCWQISGFRLDKLQDIQHDNLMRALEWCLVVYAGSGTTSVRQIV